ncbi:beta strand repeat-containing protein [Winogradskyella pulchriflava]|uniref:Beta strand repeat-containing protein n=1 Tax=Winogradskyella pulchriflava TaxID=1110688 RepID=A0ABV6Q4U8_9FLAO
MKKNYSLIFLAFLCFVMSGYGQSDVIISQYTETNTGTTPKGIEIFNVSGAPITFTPANNLEVFQGTNGVPCTTSIANITSGTLATDEVWVIGTSELTDYATANGTNLSGVFVNNSIAFNGDDALTVTLGGTIQDMFGLCGTDPGSAWTGSGVSTQDNNLQIKNAICDGDTDGWTDPSVRFDQIAIGSTMTGFGDAPASCSTPTPAITINPASLSGFSAFVGAGASAEQTFTVEGTLLTGIVTLTVTGNFEISLTSGGPYSTSLVLTPSLGTLSSTTVYVRMQGGLSIGTYSGDVTGTSTGASSDSITLDGEVTGSNNSDIIAVAASEAATISSTVNNPAPLTSTQGVQVWQITVRDGGASAPDADNLDTILTDLTFAQAAGNQVTTWTDAIETIALFNGTTRVATGTVTANQIQFTGMNVVVADDTQTTLTVRLSLQCPLGADAFDNEDFGFSLSNANTTFSPTGSGKASFPAITSTNGQNVIEILASQLIYTAGPTSTGVNSPMNDVIVSATDSCGNIDTDFAGTVSLTSTGTMTGDPLSATMTSGQAVFTSIVHTATDTNRILTASITGLSIAVSSPFDITNTTTLLPGDLAILAVNVNIDDGNGSDQVAFVCFQDILPGTTFYLTDNGYEREFAGLWGGTEGVIEITRTGTTLAKGTVIVFQGNNGNTTSGSHFDIYTCGSVDTNWTKSVLAGGSGFNLNSDDDIWIMQGGVWVNDTGHASTYTGGNVLYGWTESGWNTAPGGSAESTRWSTIYPGLDCFNTVAPTGPGFVKFNDPVNPDFSTATNGRIDWIALINDTSNWDTYTNNALYAAGGYDYIGNTSCPAMTIATSTYTNGKWIGRKDTNWFDCANWDTFTVPDETVDVLIEDHPTYNNFANVDATATYADDYGNIAKARNLTITGDKVEISGDINNILEVHGNLYIDTNGALDMDDGNSGTSDGQLFISGNWTNIPGETAFDEGNGTVIFNGTAIQSITYGGTIPFPPPPFESEVFYNVVLDNDFDISNTDRTFYMDGNLTINSGRSLNVQSGQYVHVGNIVTNQGTFTLEDSASLTQVNDVTNVGNLTMKRNSYVKTYDYVYWSSPVSGFNTDDLFTSSDGYIYEWDPTMDNTPFGGSGQGYWVPAANTIMAEGKGYISRAPAYASVTLDETVFENGVPNNGDVNLNLSRGTDAGSDNDDWNLVGNPYPSAISAMAFLTANTNLDGYVNLWTHGAPPLGSEPDPFYENNSGFNYDEDDYITANGTATTCSPNDATVCFDGYIASGQSFMVNTINGAASTTLPIAFTNSMRQRDYDNSNFLRPLSEEKHRIWLDFALSDADTADRIVIGYVSNATMGEDRLYDAKWTGNEAEQRFYSILNENDYLIQGRALPFSDEDVVPVGYNATTAGNYTIAINAVDGLFANDNQAIYIKDNLLNVVFNITQAPYTFNSEVGEFNDRFEIVFTPQALSIDDHQAGNNDLTIIELPNGDVQFSVGENHTIINVEILDVLGRRIYSLKGNNATEVYTLSKLSKAPYIAKVTLSNGQTISKKAIKRK